MPFSQDDGKPETLEWVKNNNISTILDVGPGIGTYANFFEGLSFEKFDAVEIWEPYVEKYDLKDKYDNVYVEDIRTWDNFNYDLVIFGDVLEHMTKDEAIAVWTKASSAAKHAIISIPIVHMPQHEHEGNPYEEHVKDDWSADEVLETFPGIVDHVRYAEIGVFYATFKS